MALRKSSADILAAAGAIVGALAGANAVGTLVGARAGAWAGGAVVGAVAGAHAAAAPTAAKAMIVINKIPVRRTDLDRKAYICFTPLE
ncbi:MAG: hypothetical protein ACM3S0_07280 [Acidobacteriota bacterium]